MTPFLKIMFSYAVPATIVYIALLLYGDTVGLAVFLGMGVGAGLVSIVNTLKDEDD